MFTVDNEEEAKLLITLACPMNYDGAHFAPELADEQTLENLTTFSDRLDDLYRRFIAKARGAK